MALTRPTAAQINTVITSISDPIMVLNQGSTAANIDIGFILNRSPSANVAMVWQASSNQFIFANTSSSGTTNANITVSNYADLRAGNLITTSVTYANGQSILTNVESAITTANTNMKGYVDAANTIQSNQITTVSNSVTGANAAIVTANTALKGYVDAANTIQTTQITTVSNSVTGANAAIVTANTAMKGYVDGQITTRAALSGAVFTGAVTTTELFVTSAGGDEGGQLNLANATTNTTLSGNIVIDVYQNKLRIFEGGGTARGGYFDLSGLSAGVGTNLAAGGGGTPGGTNSQIQFNNSSSFGGALSLYYFSGNGVVLANAAVQSTSTTTGALQVSGGIGVAGNVWCGQVYSTNNGNGTNYRIGDDAWLGDVNTADTTQLMGAQNGNNGYLRFGNVGTETLGRAGSGALTWTGAFSVTGNITAGNVSATNITGTLLTAAQPSITSVGTLGSLSVTGNISAANSTASFGLWGTIRTAAQTSITSVGNLSSFSVAGISSHFGVLYANAAVASTTTGTGALVVLGGAGISGNVYTGGIVDITSTAASTSTTTGALIVDGGAGIAGNVTSGANVVAAHQLRVNSGNFTVAIVNSGTNGVGNIGASGAGFNTVFAKSTSAQYADLAEVYRSDRNYIPGTVVVFGGTSEVTVSLTSHDTKVAGVVSTNPAYLMNDREDGAAVALQGRVPCRVLGPVVKGDRVVTSDVRGVAQRLDMTKYQPGCIIGKTLGSVPDGEIATIEVVVGRN